MKIYTGIGSRKTPLYLQNAMTDIARALDAQGWTLRSGGADGADNAFEQGSTRAKIYLPWNGFNNRYEGLSPKNRPDVEYIVPPYREDFVEDYHPNTLRLSKSGWRFMSRNSYQVLGDDLDRPELSRFVICYTEDGKASGGTGQALRIARDYGVKIYNLYFETHLQELMQSYCTA